MHNNDEKEAEQKREDDFARTREMVRQRIDHQMKFPGHESGFTLCYTCRIKFGD